jgi:hypothetical protein
MEHSCGPLAVESFPGKQESTANSAPIFPRERELSLAHVQRCSFLIMDQCCGPLTVQNCSRKALRFQHLSCQESESSGWSMRRGAVSRLWKKLWSPGSRNFSWKAGKHCDFSTYLAKRARAQAGACAEVQFPDSRTVLWSPVGRNVSRKTLRIQNQSCQESENSACRNRRGAFSCLWNSAVVPWQ